MAKKLYNVKNIAIIAIQLIGGIGLHPHFGSHEHTELVYGLIVIITKKSNIIDVKYKIETYQNGKTNLFRSFVFLSIDMNFWSDTLINMEKAVNSNPNNADEVPINIANTSLLRVTTSE